MLIWWFLLAISVAALLAHWRAKNAVWGTATFGAIVGVAIAIFSSGFDWWLVGKAFIVGTFIGVALEWLSRLAAKNAK